MRPRSTTTMARMPGPARVSSASTRSSAAVVATALPSGQTAPVSAYAFAPLPLPLPLPVPVSVSVSVSVPASALAGADVGAAAVGTGAATAVPACASAGWAGCAGTEPTWDANSKLPSATTAQPVPGRATANP